MRYFILPLILTACQSALAQQELVFLDSFENGSDALNAPPLEQGVGYSLYDATRFLYVGAEAVQTDIDPDIIDRQRVAVIRGRVLNQAGLPTAGVAIDIAGRPEFGRTQSRSDGRFDLVVNGGGRLTINLQDADVLPLQRSLEVPWEQYAILDDVVVTQLADKVDTIVLAPGMGMQVAEGPVTEDGEGMRQPALLFPDGIAADMVMADGSRQQLDQINVRATEYTVGPSGPQAMPGALPLFTDYTYAVEFSADEAIAAGAGSVEFDQPVAVYLENFREFPVGSTIPTGYYDKTQARWIAAVDGLVIQYLDASGGLANLDLDGDGLADDDTALEAFGINSQERVYVASRYTPGQTLWRTAVDHFTPWDLNDVSNPADARPVPDPIGEPDRANVDDPCEDQGSVIECQNLVVGQMAPIQGTSLILNYRSDRLPGRKDGRQINIDLGSPDQALETEIDLSITVAGQEIKRSFGDQGGTFAFEWDGLDAYGRPVDGPVMADIKLLYTSLLRYCAFSAIPGGRSFGRPVLSRLCDPVSSVETTITNSRSKMVTLSTLDYRTVGLGGWSLDLHHRYDPVSKILYFGDGREITDPEATRGVVETLAGGGTSSADNIAAVEADLAVDDTEISGLAISPQGHTLLSLDQQHVVREVDASGVIRTVAGTLGTRGFAGDGGPAVDALLDQPTAMEFGPNGGLFILDTGNRRIRKIDSSGVITTVAGGGSEMPDTGLATLEADLEGLRSLAVGPDGTLYFGITGAGGMWSAGPDGFLTQIVPFGTPSFIEIDIQGRLYYVLDQGTQINQVVPGGIVGIDFGSPDSLEMPLSKGEQFFVRGLDALTTTAEGSIVIADDSLCMRKVDAPAYQRAYEIPESGFFGFTYSGPRLLLAGLEDGFGVCQNLRATESEPHSSQALTALFSGNITDLEMAPDGSVVIADAGIGRVRRLRSALPGSKSDFLIADPNLAQVYRFNAQGRHLATLNSLTGDTLNSFEYTASGRLSAVVDGFGQRVSIERDADGRPAAIVAPLGHRTTLGLDDNGYLSAITNAAGETLRAAYDSQGLLTEWTTPNDHTTVYLYNSRGQLESFSAADGYGLSYSSTRQRDAREFTTTSASGAQAISRIEITPDDNRLYIHTNRDGHVTQVEEGRDSSLQTIYPSGKIEHSALNTAALGDNQTPSSEVFIQQSPAGRTLSVTTRRDFDSEQDNPLAITSISLQRQVGNRVLSTDYDGASRSFTTTTPVGRVQTTQVDGFDRIVERNYSNDLDNLVFEYDAFGRLVLQQSGQRSVSYEYDPSGNLVRQLDAAGRERTYTYDAADRTASYTSPAGRSYQFGYDSNGNLVRVTMPGGQTHQIGYSVFDDLASYQAPGAAAISQVFDLDRYRTQIINPDGNAQVFSLTPGGLTTSVAYPEATVDFDYAGNSSRLQSHTWTTVNDSRSHTGSFTYDGDVLLSMVTGADSFSYRYDNDLRLAGIQLNAEPELAIVHDDDDLVTMFGPFAISRDGPAAKPNQYTDGRHVINIEYDRQGRISRRIHTVEGIVVYDLALNYDATGGRVISRTETVLGVSRTLTSAFTLDGELSQVQVDGSVVESYSYDANGNRELANGVAAAFNAQDQIQSAGGLTYSFDANGRLASRGSDLFQYSARGELLSVQLSGGDHVAYTYDGLGRMVERITDAGTESYLFGDPNQPFQVSAYRSASGVLNRYVYDSNGMLIRIIRGTEVFHVATDQVGSPRVIVDASGVAVRELLYDSFGRVLSDSNPGFALALGFAGGIADPDTGMVRMGLRDYDPAAGRWLARDPLLFAAGQFNLYAYAKNNPIEFRDPTGLFCVGFSAYEGYGGGLSFCYKEGRWSVCGEVGFAVGVGVELDLDGEPNDSFADLDYTTLGLSAGCGPVNLGAAVKLDNCGRFTKSINCNFGVSNLCQGKVRISDENVGSLRDAAKPLADKAPSRVRGTRAAGRGKLKCKASAGLKGGLCLGTHLF